MCEFCFREIDLDEGVFISLRKKCSISVCVCVCGDRHGSDALYSCDVSPSPIDILQVERTSERGERYVLLHSYSTISYFTEGEDVCERVFACGDEEWKRRQMRGERECVCDVSVMLC